MKLPIGESSFKKLVEQGLYFIDKSLFIKEILDDVEVILITRPRRFGKTLNLWMLRCFFAETVLGEPTAPLFEGLNISQAGKEVLQHQGKYPVIFLTFKDTKEATYERAEAKFFNVVREAYVEHRYLLSSETLSEEDKTIYKSILNQTAGFENKEDALKNLSRYLFQHHNSQSIILIDEYDTPIQSSYLNQYYEPMIALFRNFLGAALKDNPYLFKAVLTGILRISRESLFSGLNNLRVYSVLKARYAEYFGFTEPEVIELLTKTNLKHILPDIKNWYNGYQIGETILYNPWSIMNCVTDKGELRPYWINTSDNGLIKELLLNSEVAFKERFEDLMAGKTIEYLITEQFTFPDLKKKRNEGAIWSLLLMAGYLKVVRCQNTDRGAVCQLAIPNREVRSVYLNTIEEWLSNEDGVQWYLEFIQALLKGDIEAFRIGLEHTITTIMSSHDTALAPEAFYHGFMIGLTASLYGHPNYETVSNREAGYGRYDFMIYSRDPEKFTILFEFKKVELPKQKDKKHLDILKKAATKALSQIDQQAYFLEAKQRGAKRILKIGIAFSGKRFGMAYEETPLSAHKL